MGLLGFVKAAVFLAVMDMGIGVMPDTFLAP
jgi:hypothetical protein